LALRARKKPNQNGWGYCIGGDPDAVRAGGRIVDSFWQAGTVRTVPYRVIVNTSIALRDLVMEQSVVMLLAIFSLIGAFFKNWPGFILRCW
jgi:hypothetical protein